MLLIRAVRAALSEHETLGVETARWSYDCASGALFGHVSRFDPPGERKQFRPQRFGMCNGSLGWHWTAGDERRPLYNVLELLARTHDQVLVTEGEKAAEGAKMVCPDMVVTTAMHGAQSPHRTDWSPLSGRDVVISPDNDAPGRTYAEKAALIAHEAGAASVRIVNVPAGAPEKWDLADELSEGWTVETIREAIRQAPLPPRELQDEFMLVRQGDAELEPGVYVQAALKKKGEDEDDECRQPEWRPICSYLEVVADTRNAANQNWGRRLRIIDRDAKVHDWAMPKTLLAGDGTELRSTLLDLGVDIVPGNDNRRALEAYISSWEPRRRCRCVDRVGWYDELYVTADAVYGRQVGEEVLLQTSGRARPHTRRGDLAGWQQDVGRLAIGNTRLAFSISVALIGAVKRLLHEESGGFNLRGKSSGGKSTILKVAASVWGCPVHSWRTTSNGAEAIAAAANDGLLVLDEVGQVDPREADALSYMLANGAGKARMSRSLIAREPPSWVLALLSSGEISLGEKIREGGRKVRAGQEVRVVDVPADAGAGMGAFEQLHGFASPDAFARHLQTASQQHVGHAAPAFLTKLVEDLAGHVDTIGVSRKDWVGRNVPPGADGQVSRVAAHFGLAAAVGELAAYWGVLPWDEGEAERAATACFRAWLRERGGIGAAELRDGFAEVRAFIESHGSGRFEPWPERIDGASSASPMEAKTINRAGFRRLVDTVDGQVWEYAILPEAWRNEVCAGRDAQEIAREMAARGWLRPGDGNHLQHKVTVPGHKTKRMYVVTPEFLAAAEGE